MEASATGIVAGRLGTGQADARDRALARRVERRLSTAVVLVHTLGALDVFVLLFGILPTPHGVRIAEHLTPNLIAIAAYFPLATVLGIHLGSKLSPERWAWIRANRPPTPEELEVAVKIPLRCLRLDAGLWLGGVILFTAVNAPESGELALHMAVTIALGGITTCAVTYLVVEKLSRPVVELALVSGPPQSPVWPGVKGRMILAWAAASGVPLVGLVLLGLAGLFDDQVSRTALARSTLALGLAGFALGLGTMLLAARSVSRPLTALRRAMARVEAGDLSTDVRVDDASEIGLLQTGFNRMAAGLRERERVTELFSRQVGEDVARAALGANPRLGGEVHETAVLFVDLIGSTAYTLRAPPEHVLARLNRFFAIVVDVIDEHGGWVNKFEGDAALCIFGAPEPLEDPAGCALRAARALQARLRSEMPSAHAGIGLSAGQCVAGWVGAERRFEYTVVGDPVNEAARLCELAKDEAGGLLASEAVVSRARNGEGERWRLGDAKVLRGREQPTRLAVPLA